MTLRWRIAVVMASLCATVAALAAIGAYVSTSHQLSTQLDSDLAARAVAVGVGPETKGPTSDSECPPRVVFGPVDAAQITQPDGNVSVCITTARALPAATATVAKGTADLTTSTVDGVSYRIASSPFHGGGSVQIARSTASIDSVLATLQRRLLLLTLGSTLLGGFAGWLLATWLVAPVERVRRAARAIASTQDLTIPMPVDGPAELRDLGHDIATMVTALAASRAQQHQLVTDASHEFRTPLTSLTTNLDLLERFDEIPADERPDILAALRVDVDELTHLARDLVELATDRSIDEEPVETTLADLVEPVILRARRRSGRDIEMDNQTRDLNADAVMFVKPQMIQRAASNLIENAVKYAPTGMIIVRVSVDTIEVLDHGPGIDSHDARHMFERFWRSDSARGLPGSGLGLSIVAQIASQHGGEVWAKPGVDGGMAVGFRLTREMPPGD